MPFWRLMSESFICKTGNPTPVQVCALSGIPHAAAPAILVYGRAPTMPGSQREGLLILGWFSRDTVSGRKRKANLALETSRVWFTVSQRFVAFLSVLYLLRTVSKHSVAVRSHIRPTLWSSTHSIWFPHWSWLYCTSNFVHFATVFSQPGTLFSLAYFDLTHLLRLWTNPNFLWLTTVPLFPGLSYTTH